MNGYLNCWEYFRCGRQPGGNRTATEGICAAAIENRVNGVNDGLNGGRCCWAISGTFGKSTERCKVDGIERVCMSCDFFWLVQEQSDGFGAKVLEIRKLLDGPTSYSKIGRSRRS